MPYQWVDPELFLEHDGVAVYHCYDNDKVVSLFWYTTDAADDNCDSPNSGRAQFDVRDLPHIGLDANDWNNHAAIIQHAIRAELVTGEPVVNSEPESLTVIIEVQSGLAEVIEKPPGVEVKIIDHDLVDERDPCSPDMSQMPSAETLLQWLDEGGSEAIDGCWVEPDGVCPHGCQSWLLVLGMI
jgi:hypothetical protein